MIRAYLATFDLATETLAAVRARLGDDSVEVHSEQPGLWHLTKDGRQAVVRKLGTTLTAESVYLVVGPEQIGGYLATQLGATRVELLADAWVNPGTPAALGGITRRAWLEARGFSSDPATDHAICLHTLAGVSPRALGSNYADVGE